MTLEQTLPAPTWLRTLVYVLGPLVCYLLGTAVVEGILLYVGAAVLLSLEGEAAQFLETNAYWLLALGSAVLLYPFFLRRYFRDWRQRVCRAADGTLKFCLRESGTETKNPIASWFSLWRGVRAPFLLIAFAAAAACCGTFLLNFLARSWTFLLGGAQQQNEVILRTNLGVVFLTSVLAVPLFEELVFRGLFYRRLRDFCGVRFSALFTALCFGFLHETVAQAALGILMGLLFAWVYERFQSLAAATLAHMAANAVNFIFLAASKEAELMGSLSLSPFLLVLLLIGSGAAAVMLYRCLLRIPPAPTYLLYTSSLAQGEQLK